MPAVLVHGVPDTAEMWEPMRAQLTRDDIVALQLPGLWGADDPYVASDYAARLARRIDGELLVFDECPHWWPWEHARESAAALERRWKDAP
jgi:pimeloyl-ACP methyl ester carboxylesterase